jgi:hypothetical protein
MMTYNVLVATPRYRLYGEAIVAQLKCLQALAGEPDVRVDHLDMHAYPLPAGCTGDDQILAQYQKARSAMLAGFYDCLVTIEDDMVPPIDGLIRLVSLLRRHNDPIDVAYGLYCWRHGWKHRWSAYTEMTETAAKSISDDPALITSTWNQVIPVTGVGLGFTAIKAHVLQSIRFRAGGDNACDWPFALDVKARGYVSVCDLSLRVGHMTLEPTARIIYPACDPDTIYREEFVDVRNG